MQIWNHFEENRKRSSNLKLLYRWRLIYFCCFREFYYIQMEKYARQAVSEGVKNVDDLRVGGDSEIYRVLNLHYNRNNHIEVNWPLYCAKFSEKKNPIKRRYMKNAFRILFKKKKFQNSANWNWLKPIDVDFCYEAVQPHLLSSKNYAIIKD